MSVMTQIGIFSYLRDHWQRAKAGTLAIPAGAPQLAGIGLIEKHPDDRLTPPKKPAIYSAYRNKNPNVWPQVTMNEEAASPYPEDLFSSTLKVEAWMFQIWDNQTTALRAKQIAEALDYLLHETEFPLTGGRLDYIGRSTSALEGYDDTRSEYFSVLRYRLTYTPL